MYLKHWFRLDLDPKFFLPKFGFSGIVARGDINKEEDIVSTNNKLEKYCEGNQFFYQ